MIMRSFVALCLMSVCAVASAQSSRQVWEEFDKRIERSRAVSALGSDLMGDRVSLSDGSLSFAATDVAIAGNDRLSVAFSRTYAIKDRFQLPTDLPLADWDLDVPNISGVFAPDWLSSSPTTPNQRCSVSNAMHAIPRAPTWGGYTVNEYWQGYHLNLPGGGGGELLMVASGTTRPATGGPYYWVAGDQIYISCLEDVQNGSGNGAGEGFLAITPDGTRYRFDQMAQYEETYLGDPNSSSKARRKRNVLYASRVEDRFGNWVEYSYANNWDQPARLTRILASDGRDLTISYNSDNHIAAVVEGVRTWTYQYTALSGGRRTLSAVVQPDGSQWSIGFSAFTSVGLIYPGMRTDDPLVSPYEPVRDCLTLSTPVGPHQFLGSITHPSGATGHFTVNLLEHGRSNVPVNCHGVASWLPQPSGSGNNTNNDVNFTPISYYGLSLVSKTLTGPGAVDQQWTYSYEPGISTYFYPGVAMGYPVCPVGTDCSQPICVSDACAGSSRTIVTASDGSWTRYSHGNSYRYNEGKLLKMETGSGNTLLRTVSHAYDFSQADQQYPARYGSSPREHPEGFSSEYHRPLRRTDTVQQGVTFTWQAMTGCAGGTYCFDYFARPTRVGRSSTLAGNPAHTQTTEYHDNLSYWVLGQPGKVTCVAASPADGACDGQADSVVSETSYDSYALPTLDKQFGKTVLALTYDTNSSVASGQRGTVATVSDGNGNVTTVTGWKRGIPGSIRYPATPEAPTGATRSAAINDQGWITSINDELNSKTCYGYDVMGRITTITYPSESAANVCDTSHWLVTSISFAKSTAASYGLPAGHWQQTVSTGAARKTTYFDAFWRPVVSESFDNSNAAGTRSVSVQRYDTIGRQVFESYPMSNLGNYALASLKGTHRAYDALSRVTQVGQDWEGAGLLTTSTEYLAGFQTRVTPPRGQGAGAAFQTTTRYQAWDQPIADYPVAITHPAGAHTDITRDAFGKPVSIVRRDTSGATSLARSYVYDAYQQLCKSVEPETGATLMDYDGAGNLAWSKSGAMQIGTGACNTSEVPTGERTVRTYDGRNRLQTLSFPDGRGNQAWSYTRNGLPATVTTNNASGGGVVTNSYVYNRRGLPVSESFGVASQSWALGYAYNPLGNLASHTTPGLIIDYAPNALGQPTKAGTYATAVSYFPNGGIQQFTYGNGVKHTLAQNGRGLPETSCDFSGSSCTASAVLRDSYDYDHHGNVLAITDGRTGSRGNRDMAYDALDRLTQAVSPMFGTTSYGYDVLDNLRTVQVTGGTKIRNHSYVYDAANRLTNVTNTQGGATVIGLGYDLQGNLANKNGTLYLFDFGNRLREASGEQYSYDGHGRRVLAVRNGQSLYSLYAQDGTLRFQRDERMGKTIDYVHLGGSLVAQVENAIALSTPALTAPGSSATGNYSVSWTSSAVASKYQLQERLGSGGWSTVHDTAGTSKAISGKAAGSWGYQVRACSATTCGNWSVVATVAVQLPPVAAPTLTAPATGLNGSFVVGWTAVSAADRYQLQERLGSGGWSTAHDAAGTSKAISGKAAGSWGYQVRGCNNAGCGGWSAIGSVQVIHMPANAPVLTVPATNLTGGYTVSWTSVAASTRYEMEERLGTGGWTQVHNAAVTSKAISGKTTGSWGYRVRACNEAGCSGWSSIAVTAVIRPPTSAPALTTPASNTSGSYSANWTAVTHASSYQLQERLGTAGWATIHDAAATSKAISGKSTGSWGYQVRACNAAGCSAWSSLATVAVLRAPTGVPTLSAPASTTSHSYTVSWTSVTDGARYELEEQINSAGVWNKVHDAATTSKAFSGKQTGSYAYRVRACNTTGCAGWSATGAVVVTLPIPLPIGAPSAYDWGSRCDVSWQTSGGATYYEVTYAGSVPLYSGPNTSKSSPGMSCVSPYHVRACNANGCSAWSPPGQHRGSGSGPIQRQSPSDEGDRE